MSKWFECQGTLFNLDKFDVISKDYMCANDSDYYACVEKGEYFFLITLDKKEDINSESIIFDTENQRNETFEQIKKLLLEENCTHSRCY